METVGQAERPGECHAGIVADVADSLLAHRFQDLGRVMNHFGCHDRRVVATTVVLRRVEDFVEVLQLGQGKVYDPWKSDDLHERLLVIECTGQTVCLYLTVEKGIVNVCVTYCFFAFLGLV